MKNILFISGSLRSESVNTKLLKAFENSLPEDVVVDWADINLPLFNEDLEKDFPTGAEQLRQQIIKADRIIISTPEYNRTTTGALKNAIDWASRPYGENAWEGKNVLVTSASPGMIGGVIALYHVKQSLLHLGAHVPGQPEFILGDAFSKFDESGALVDERTQKHIDEAITIFLS